MSAETTADIRTPHTLAAIKLERDKLSIALSEDEVPAFCLSALVLFSFPEEPETSVPIAVDELQPNGHITLRRPSDTFSFRLVTVSELEGDKNLTIVRPGCVVDEAAVICNAFSFAYDRTKQQ